MNTSYKLDMVAGGMNQRVPTGYGNNERDYLVDDNLEYESWRNEAFGLIN